MKKLFTAVVLILFSVLPLGSSQKSLHNETNIWTYQSYESVMENRKKQLTCLAKNIYFEARNEPFAGQFAVALVTLNRVRDTSFPDTICKVVYQGIHTADGFPKRDRCQFSWYCDGKADIMYNEEAVYLATDIAKLVLDISTGVLGDQMFTVDITEGSTHYHATYVDPYWTNDRGMAKITQVGSHIFYRWGE